MQVLDLDIKIFLDAEEWSSLWESDLYVKGVINLNTWENAELVSESFAWLYLTTVISRL